MGAAPRAPPSPHQVASSFTGIYYRVAAKMPNQLFKLYDASSELDHGPGLTANGVSAINPLCERLPLANSQVSVSSLNVQQTGTGAYVVSVIGSFGPATSLTDLPTTSSSNTTDVNDLHDSDSYLQRLRRAHVVFSQSFVLEKTPDSHDDHFFCRNDIFTPVMLDDKLFASAKPDQPLPPIHSMNTSADNSPSDVHSNNPVVDQVEVASLPASSVASASDHTTGVSVQDVTNNTVTTADTIPNTDSHVIAQVTSMPLADAVVNGTASVVTEDPVVTSVADDFAEQIINDTTTPNPNTTSEIIPDATDVATGISEETNVNSLPNGVGTQQVQSITSRVPPVPVKKTWASIVSSKDDLPDNSAVLASEDPTSVTPAIAPVSSDPNVSVPTTNQELANPSVSDPSKNPSQYHISNGQRTGQHHNYGHMNRNNNQRQYGPSAVVQLSSLGPELLQDARSLSLSMREEFSNYGHRARHVEVKLQKGIAFVEYDSMDGVKSAVAAWANGPRTTGTFAGIALNVTEKRPFYNRRPNSIRGGRGGTRGGRRNNNRPTSTPMS